MLSFRENCTIGRNTSRGFCLQQLVPDDSLIALVDYMCVDAMIVWCMNRNSVTEQVPVETHTHTHIYENVTESTLPIKCLEVIFTISITHIRFLHMHYSAMVCFSCDVPMHVDLATKGETINYHWMRMHMSDCVFGNVSRNIRLGWNDGYSGDTPNKCRSTHTYVYMNAACGRPKVDRFSHCVGWLGWVFQNIVDYVLLSDLLFVWLVARNLMMSNRVLFVCILV